MTRTPEDLRATFARHAAAPIDSTERLQVVVDNLSKHSAGPGTHHRKWAPFLVSAAVVAVLATVVVVVSNNRASQAVVAGASDGGTSTSVSDTPFTLPPMAGKTEYSFSVGQRKVLRSVFGPRLDGNGATLQLSDFAGKVVVINIWGSWCAPCRSELPSLKAAYTELAPAGVQFLGIDIKDNPISAAAAGVPYASIFDPASTTLTGQPIGSVPTTIVLDRQHRVAHLWLQQVTQTSLTAVVQAVLAES